MILTLEVIGADAERLGAARRKVFSAIGGTIGRLPDNDWVFPDPYVSGRHALIRYLNGKYFVEDTSTNGVFINSPDRRLTRGEPQQLRHGDLLYIDAYEIRVQIQSDTGASVAHPLARFEARPSRPPPVRQAPEPFEEDRTATLDLKWPVLDGVGEHSTEWFGLTGVGDHDQAPPQCTPTRPEKPRPIAAARAPRRSSSPATRPLGRPSFQAQAGAPAPQPQLEVLLQAAGIEGLDPSSEAAQTLGQVLRTAVGGLMEVLRARERMKDELRMRATTFKAAHNNPLKFSANVEDAFHNLLVKRNPAYLAPSAAFEDAFGDVRDHQLATLAALRFAFEAVLAQFDPNRLQEDFDRQMKKGSILGVPAKLRYWDLYRDKYNDLVKDGPAAFRTLFSDEFSKAYEEELGRLKAANRGREQ
jgi:type VI secretion system FHA domain protein